MRITLPLCSLLASAALGLAANASDTPTPGFGLTAAVLPDDARIATLSNGDLVTFDGTLVRRWTPGGALAAELGDITPFIGSGCDAFAFPECVFSGVFEIDPTESFLLLGESSYGDLFQVDLAGGGIEFVLNLPFNYDATFETGTTVIVSAALGFVGPNRLWRVDLEAPSATEIASIAGASGPVAFDSAGNLFYATVTTDFTPPPGTTDVLLFTAAQLASRVLLTEGDAIVWGPGFDGAGDLICGDDPGEVFLAENYFFGGTNRLWQVVGGPGTSLKFVEGESGRTLTDLEFAPGTGAAILAAFQPESGGTLRYTSTDFVTPRREAMHPQRPEATVTGPGTSGVGAAQFELTGGRPNGAMVLMYGLQSTYSPMEASYVVNGLPIHTGLDPFSSGFLPFFLPLDGSGTGSFDFFNTGGLNGLLVLQGLVTDASGNMLGTSQAAFF